MSLLHSTNRAPEPTTPRPDATVADAVSPARPSTDRCREKPSLPARTPPIVPVALALIAGICFDRHGGFGETKLWLDLTVACSFAAGVVVRRGKTSSAFILLALTTLGAAWHHHRWSDVSGDDLSRRVNDTPRPAWVAGMIVESLGFRPGKTTEDSGTTRFVLETQSAHNANGEQSCSGRVLVIVSGDRTDILAGNLVEAAGNLSTVPGPLNPGEFHYRDFLRAQGIRLRLSISDSVGIWAASEPRGSPFSLNRWFTSTLGKIRLWSQKRLTERLDARTAALASALLLGRREGVDSDINDAFAQTGTTHLLAISGLHLQVLAFTLGATLRGLGVGRRSSYAIVAIATLAYALLVGLMPSVVRSATMTLTVCLAGMLNRRHRAANTFALAIVATLTLNPANLFDTGCQLSFLAVAAIYWIVIPVIKSIHAWRNANELDVVEAMYASTLIKRARGVRLHLEESLILSTIVWLAAVPLVALKFHIVSHIGVILNIPLIPITSLALFSSALTLLMSLIWEQMSVPFARLTEILLDWTTRLVLWGERQRWGSWYVSEPSWGWVLGLYFLGSVVVVAFRARLGITSRRIALSGFSAWLLVGVIAMIPWQTPAPRAEILAVGHGLSVVIETGPGRAILYDCGRMRDPSVGRRIIAPALWARGISKLDAIIISHADADHYNGLHEVIERFPVNEIIVTEHFDTAENPGISDLLKPARDRRIPIREGVAGKQWTSGNGRVHFKILHPKAGFAKGSPDNARSMVLEVSDGKRRLLLTGDLEGVGLQTMIATPLEHPPDILLAPHHGAWTANPTALYEWARPRQVVVSQRPPMPGTRDALSKLRPPVSRTWERGALRLQWERDGIRIDGFNDNNPR